MNNLVANYFKIDRKAQMKIQQMAFVLVAVMVFFAMVALVYLTIRTSQLRSDVLTTNEDGAKELVRKLAGSPEFSWKSDESCAACVDMDKIMALKERKSYLNFWKIDYLSIEKIYPLNKGVECTNSTYPNCGKVILIKSDNYGSTSEAFVSLCRWEATGGGHSVCEMGRIIASGKGINK